VEKIFTAFCAEGRRFDVRIGNSCIEQLSTIRGRKIEMGFWPLDAAFDGRIIHDALDHFFADFITAHPNVRADDGTEGFRLELKFFNQPCCRTPSDSRCRPAPTRVDGRNSAAFAVGNQNRNTVGGLHTESDPAQRSYSGISLDGVTGGGSVVHIHYDAGMNLLQLDERPPNSINYAEEPNAIDLNHRIWRIERSEREIGALTTTRGKPVNDAGNRRQQVGLKERYLVLALYL
jgi:hypothetical protein